MNNYVLDIKEITIRLLVAVVLGGLIGWERERKEGAAGLRTHMLVCIASSLIMIVSSFGFKDVIGHPGISLDPSRIAAQVISGVGFLGAGLGRLLRARDGSRRDQQRDSEELFHERPTFASSEMSSS